MFKGHCFPKAIILQAVYFKLRFSLSYRDVEELLSIRGIKENEDISINSEYIQILCKYLNYQDYNHFVKETIVRSNNRFVSYLRSHWIILLICFVTITSTVGIVSINKQICMIWDNDRYIETDFNEETFLLNKLKLYNEDRIENFQKITPTCETVFFNENGSEKLWYGKNKKGDLEYFTSIGKHPKTGKTLKPITVYMIKKYICDNYH